MYNFLSKFILRTPYFYYDLLEKKDFKYLINDKIFKEAIFLASPDLYTAMINISNKSYKKQTRIKNSLYRYAERMSTRCTPFGLFAGISLGNIGDNTELEIHKITKNVRLDFCVLYSIIKEIEKKEDIRLKLKYYPNSSIYKVNRAYRYLEYDISNIKQTQLSTVKYSHALSMVIKSAKNGITIYNIVDIMMNIGISHEIAYDYANRLIDNNILISELEPSIINGDNFERIIDILENINYKHVNKIKEIESKLKQLSSGEYNLEIYHDVINILDDLNVGYLKNRVFNINISKELNKCTIDKKVILKLKDTMSFLYRINSKVNNPNLDKFKKEFYQRFENNKVRLVDALDPIIGIEYPCLNKSNKSDILRNIEFPNENVISSISSVSGIENILLNKIVYAYKNRDNIIELKEDDFPKKEFYYKDLPDTMYVVFNIINNKHTINLKGFYGASAANIISRFYFIDKRIEHIINRIVNIETDLNKDKILAEILHIPNLVVANVTVRPNIRNFKISYINNHIDGIESIDLMDIDIFLDYDGNLSLWSNKLKKQIIPMLTNAHNFEESTLPIYRFLCDLQSQNKLLGLRFSWGSLINKFIFFPRVIYGDVILSPSLWRFTKKEIQELIDIKDSMEKIEIWRNKFSLPLKNVYSDFDNELLICWNKQISINSFIQIIKNRNTLILKEFLYDNYDIVKDTRGECYINENIAFLYRNSYE